MNRTMMERIMAWMMIEMVRGILEEASSFKKANVPGQECAILDEEICLLNILLDFSPNNLFVIRLCTIVN